MVTQDIPPNMIATGNPAEAISSLDEYILKIEAISSEKRIFNEKYFIDNLDEEKRQEIIQSIGNTIGFIV